MKTSLGLTALIAAVAASAAVHAAPILQAQAFDGTLAGTPIALTTLVNSNGTLIDIGSDANFSTVSLSGSGVPNTKGLALTTLDVVANTAATLTIVLSQTGLTATSPMIPFQATFTANALDASQPATFTYTDFVSRSNQAFDTNPADLLVPAIRLADVTGSSSAAESGSATGLSLTTPYSETQVIQIDFTQATSGTTSASSQLIPVPEPTSIALLGSSLLALGMLGRRWTRRS